MIERDLIAEARALCAKATRGPWEIKIHNEDYGQGYGETTYFVDMDNALLKIGIADSSEKYAKYSANAALIARSRTIIPELCDALEKAQPQWISVKDGLPGPDERVIVFIQKGCRQNGMYLANHKPIGASPTFWGVDSKPSEWTVRGFSYIEEPNVTHWIKLPLPPKEDADA